jgi:hypothetical protein
VEATEKHPAGKGSQKKRLLLSTPSLHLTCDLSSECEYCIVDYYSTLSKIATGLMDFCEIPLEGEERALGIYLRIWENHITTSRAAFACSW